VSHRSRAATASLQPPLHHSLMETHLRPGIFDAQYIRGGASGTALKVRARSQTLGL
jgi:hypothetical protein